MSLVIQSFRSTILIIIITISLILFIDFFLGKKIMKLIKNNKDNKHLLVTREKPTIKNSQYKYNFKKNLNQKAFYIRDYTICTNKISLRVDCEDENKDNLNYDILFIGDSFTEGVAQPYKKTFVGIFEEKVKFRVGNLAVSSYSPYVYYNKIKAYSKKINFNNLSEVIVFIDISDVEDDIKTNSQINNNEMLISSDINDNKIKKFNLVLIKTFLKKQFPISYELAFNIKNYNLPSPKYRYIKKYPRSAWTYNENFVDYDVQRGVDLNIYHMTKLYDFLKSYNVKLSIAVYPWPNTLLYDQASSKQVKIWKNFCVNRCSSFINYFPIFFEGKEKLKLNEAKKIIKKYYIKGDMHFNTLGNKKISDELIKLYK